MLIRSKAKGALIKNARRQAVSVNDQSSILESVNNRVWFPGPYDLFDIADSKPCSQQKSVPEPARPEESLGSVV